MSTFETKVEIAIAPTLEADGYDIVRIMLQGGERRKCLQIMIERKDEVAITVEDCTFVSRKTGALLDVADFIDFSYYLEVSSPGIDRPLIKLKDYERYKGHLASVDLAILHEGRKRFKGIIKAVDENNIHLEVDGLTVLLPYLHISKAKLILTDALIQQHEDQHKKIKGEQ
jgi:ribosome maturation factor RimP